MKLWVKIVESSLFATMIILFILAVILYFKYNLNVDIFVIISVLLLPIAWFFPMIVEVVDPVM